MEEDFAGPFGDFGKPFYEVSMRMGWLRGSGTQCETRTPDLKRDTTLTRLVLLRRRLCDPGYKKEMS